jgi:WD40 repeat protein
MPDEIAKSVGNPAQKPSKRRRVVSLALLAAVFAAGLYRGGQLLRERRARQREVAERRAADEARRAAEPAGREPDEYREPVRFLQGHSDGCHDVVFSADGTLLATASHDTTARLWDPKTGAQLQDFDGHEGAVYGVSISRDDRRVATAGADGVVMVWDAKSGDLLAVLEGHSGWASCVRFLPDGSLLSGDSAGAVRRWDVENERQVAAMPGHRGQVHTLAVAPDGRRALSGGADGTIVMWDLDSNRPAWRAAPQRSPGKPLNINSVAFSPDGRKAYSVQYYGYVCVWDVATGEPLRRLEDFDFGMAIDPLPDGKRAAIATARGATLWDLEPLKIRYALVPDDHTYAIAYSPSGGLVAAARGGRNRPGGGWEKAPDPRVPVWDVGGATR